ncbi:MAG TPA: hypothetical protein VM347_42070 [Nonomuraea sp.]|nr:hypothetical protein [Nonomuraea sp.]
MSDVAYRAATKVLYQRLDVMVNPPLVSEMVAAVLAAHDTVITYTEPNLLRQMWEDTRYRKEIERRMRERSLGKVVEEGCVPVALPTAKYRYFAEHPSFTMTLNRRPVLPELVELGAPWESIEVELSVPARTVEQ